MNNITVCFFYLRKKITSLKNLKKNKKKRYDDNGYFKFINLMYKKQTKKCYKKGIDKITILCL